MLTRSQVHQFSAYYESEWIKLPSNKRLSAVLNKQSIHQATLKSVIRDERGVVVIPNLDLLAGDYQLEDLSTATSFTEKNDQYLRMYEAIKAIESEYDYIIFDCAPSDFAITRLAIFASEEIVVPLNPDLFSLAGLSRIARKLTALKKEIEPFTIHLPGYIFPKIQFVIFNNRRKGSTYPVENEIIERIKSPGNKRNLFYKKISLTKISHSIEIVRSITERRPLVLRNDEISDEFKTLASSIDQWSRVT